LLSDPFRLRQISERIPAGRWGTPKDFAGPIVFLASRASQYVCGELLVVDGVRGVYPLNKNTSSSREDRLPFFPIGLDESMMGRLK
jgi:Enoyl-(Acyl carrier protein) reductase